MIPVCVFAKAPRVGHVKTRLAASIGALAAAQLASAFVEDTWVLVRSRPWARPILACAGSMPSGLLARLSASERVEVWEQGNGTLDDRIERVLARGGGAAIALGADSPGLPAEQLDAAALELAAGRAVIGPAEDGGFYLLGLPACPRGLLAGVSWSAPSTCAEVITRLANRFAVTRLARWFDVDRGADLDKLAALLAREPTRASATARILRGVR